MDMDLEIHLALDLPVGPINCLYREDIMTMGQLTDSTEADLLAIRGFGSGRLDAVVKELARHGLALAAEGPPRDRVEQLADIELRKMHREPWMSLVQRIREAEDAALVRQASMPEAEPERVEVHPDSGRRTFFMSATRRVHADGEVCDHVETCPEPSWWHVECTCGWSVNDVSKLEVKVQRLSHGGEYHNALGQSAW